MDYNNKRIKLGYFSSDFKNHAVASLVKNLFQNHNKQKFDLYGFNINRNYSKNDLDPNILKNFKEFIDCGSNTDLEIKKFVLITKLTLL